MHEVPLDGEVYHALLNECNHLTSLHHGEPYTVCKGFSNCVLEHHVVHSKKRLGDMDFHRCFNGSIAIQS